jgi:hypothetical protein
MIYVIMCVFKWILINLTLVQYGFWCCKWGFVFYFFWYKDLYLFLSFVEKTLRLVWKVWVLYINYPLSRVSSDVGLFWCIQNSFKLSLGRNSVGPFKYIYTEYIVLLLIDFKIDFLLWVTLQWGCMHYQNTVIMMW